MSAAALSLLSVVLVSLASLVGLATLSLSPAREVPAPPAPPPPRAPALGPYTLPEPVSERVLRLMDALGLNYGAFDFIVTPQGRHVFLEVNPAGEFMWLMRHPGLPIAEALADVLAGRAARRC